MTGRRTRSVVVVMCAAGVVALTSASVQRASRSTVMAQTLAAAPSGLDSRPVLNQYCIGCHSDRLHTAGLSLETIDVTHPDASAAIWERVIKKLRIGAMPPRDVLGLIRPWSKVSLLD